MNLRKWIFAFLILFLSSTPSAFASSEYVLPYPPTMPGGMMYKIRLMHEEIQKYWYFGNLSQFAYNLKQSDKYLVQAKTLFEYKQYLLGYQALEKSTDYFKKTKPFLKHAKKDGKNTLDKEMLFKSAAQKHEEVLLILLQDVPADFVWKMENKEESKLHLHELLNSAIKTRKTYE